MTTTTATEPIDAAASPASGPDAARRRCPVVLDLFSNVKFGIWILVILFIYMSVSSAGIVTHASESAASRRLDLRALRQWRPFEMTEFEWFHWWPSTS